MKVVTPSSEQINTEFCVHFFDCLKSYLAEKGIQVHDLVLSNNSDYVYSVAVQNGNIAFSPEETYWLNPCSDNNFFEEVSLLFKERNDAYRLLAVASDGKDLYFLQHSGKVISTDIDWINRFLFQSPEDVIYHINLLCKKLFSQETIDAAMEEFLSGKKYHFSYSLSVYYDCHQKALICSSEEGNAHEGIYRHYYACTKERWFSNYKFQPQLYYLISALSDIDNMIWIFLMCMPEIETKTEDIEVPDDDWLY